MRHAGVMEEGRGEGGGVVGRGGEVGGGGGGRSWGWEVGGRKGGERGRGSRMNDGAFA